MNRFRIFSIGLAMSLMVSQTAQAAVFITPFGTRVEMTTGETLGSTETETETQSQAQTQAQSQTQTQTQTQEPSAGAPSGGPGAEAGAAPVTKPSASYSTSETVTVTVAVDASQAGTQGTSGQANANQAGGTQAGTAQEPAGVADLNIPATITKPVVSAEGAILYDVTHNRFLYEKNADQKFYPASITKLLTALLVLENAKMDETVTYSKNAVTRLESGAVTLQLQEGDQVSVKDSLYGLLLKSANEVANGLAEHVGGTLYDFADMMNAKAKALGCTGSHFVNPNGLNNSDHYTTARDMAKIAKAAFANPTLCEIASTTKYTFPATKAAAARTISMGHKMVYPTDSRYYEGIVGGKTGYTSLAGNTLVTCVERDGVRMVAVVLKSRSTHYADTKAMLDYGYALQDAGVLTNAPAGTNGGQTAASGQVNAGSQNVTGQNVAAGPGAFGSGQNSGTSGGPGSVSGSQGTSSGMSGGPGSVNPGNGGQNVTMQTVTRTHRWIEDGSIWRFELADGTRLANCFVTIDGKEYAFDTEGKMVTGWLTLGPNWHYFSNSGAMIRSDWRQDDGLWFYLGADGAMMRNTWIDNVYYVGEDGVWVE